MSGSTLAREKQWFYHGFIIRWLESLESSPGDISYRVITSADLRLARQGMY